MVFFKRTCSEVTSMLVAREDRPPDWGDRVALRIHLAICNTCPDIERQILTLRQSLQNWRQSADDENTQM